MYDAELKRMRELIRTRRYVMTLHAEDEMDADGLTIFDVESVILTGQISDRQPDEWKYLVNGQALGGAGVTVVTKFSATDKLVLITVYRE
jgi:hypothetical protein